MKNYETQLLSHLQSSELREENVPLANVKKSIGKLAYVKGNPLTKTEIALDITSNYFQDLLPILPAALPNNLRTSLPCFLFGLTDYYAGYSNGLRLVNTFLPWKALNQLGYVQSSDMIDQTLLTGWFNAAYWNTFDPNWTDNIPGQQLDSNGSGDIIKNNLLKVGHKYLLVYTIEKTAAGSIKFNSTLPTITVFSSQVNINYTFVATQTNLSFTANLLVGSLKSFHVYEITGYTQFIGEPAFGIYGFTKNIVLSNNVVLGDLVLSYTAAVENTNHNIVLYSAEIIIHCNNVAYGTFLNSFVSDLITLNTIRIVLPIANINQFINPVVFGYQTLFGKLSTDSIDPRMYITSTDFQQQICDLPISLPIDKACMIGWGINYDCQFIQMILFVSKIEPLTHK